MTATSLHPPSSSLPDRVRYAAALAGPLALGAALAARTGAPLPIVALPLVILGVAAVTTPALYIATAAAGAAPPAPAMAAAVGRALGAMGVVLLGLLAPVGFLVATSDRPAGTALIALAVAGGALVGIAALHRGMFEGQPASMARELLFGGWALVALIIAARLYADLAVGGAS